MCRQLVPGPVVCLTVIKAKTRPGIEARIYTCKKERSYSNYSESLERSRLSLYKPGMLCFKVLNNGMDSVLREKDANQILFAVLPLEYGMLVSGIDIVLVGDILEANYL